MFVLHVIQGITIRDSTFRLAQNSFFKGSGWGCYFLGVADQRFSMHVYGRVHRLQDHSSTLVVESWLHWQWQLE